MYSFGYGFVEYSNPEDAKVAIDTLKGYPIQVRRGFFTYQIYINFKNHEIFSCLFCLKSLTTEPQTFLQNKRLGVTYSRSHDRTLLRDTNLYVSNIPESKCNEESLREIFKSFGTIILIRYEKNVFFRNGVNYIYMFKGFE